MILNRPIFLFAFANDAQASLRLGKEQNACSKALANVHDSRLIEYSSTGYATLEVIYDALDRFDDRTYIFHFGGHSNGKGLVLADTPGKAESLATILGRQKKLKLVFLNGCANAEQVEVLWDKGVRVIIATSADVEDEKALIFADRFYQALARGKNIKNAFDTAASFVKNDNDIVIETYRSIDLNDTTTVEFPWGLYVQDESILSWSIKDLRCTSKWVRRFQQLPLRKFVLTLVTLLLVVVVMLFTYKSREDKINHRLDIVTLERKEYTTVNFPALKYLLATFNSKFSGIELNLLEDAPRPSLKYNREKVDEAINNYLSRSQGSIVNHYFPLTIVDFPLPSNSYLQFHDHNGEKFPLFSVSGIDDSKSIGSKLIDSNIPYSYRFIIYMTIIHHLFTALETPTITHNFFSACALDYSKDKEEKILFIEAPHLCFKHKQLIEDLFDFSEDSISFEDIISFDWMSEGEKRKMLNLINNNN